MGQGREAASLLATSLHHQHTLLPGLPGLLGLPTADCTPPGLADGPDLHPLQFQFGALLGCLRRLQTTRNREEFSTTGECCGCNVQSSSVSLLSLMRN